MMALKGTAIGERVRGTRVVTTLIKELGTEIGLRILHQDRKEQDQIKEVVTGLLDQDLMLEKEIILETKLQDWKEQAQIKEVVIGLPDQDPILDKAGIGLRIKIQESKGQARIKEVVTGLLVRDLVLYKVEIGLQNQHQDRITMVQISLVIGPRDQMMDQGPL